MGREIVTTSDVQVATAKHGFAKPDGVPDPEPLDADKYRERLYKYIPSEVISLYMGTTLVLQTAGSQAPAGFGWVLFAVGLLGTWLYLRYAQGVTKPAQLAVSIGAFAGVPVATLRPALQITSPPAGETISISYARLCPSCLAIWKAHTGPDRPSSWNPG